MIKFSLQKTIPSFLTANIAHNKEALTFTESYQSGAGAAALFSMCEVKWLVEILDSLCVYV